MHDIKESHVDVIWSYLARNRAVDVPLSSTPGIPRAAVRLFQSGQIVKFTSRVIDKRVSQGAEVIKLLVQLQTGEEGDQLAAHAVLIVCPNVEFYVNYCVY